MLECNKWPVVVCCQGLRGVATVAVWCGQIVSSTQHGLTTAAKCSAWIQVVNSEVSRGKCYGLWPQCLSLICEGEVVSQLHLLPSTASASSNVHTVPARQW